MCFSLGEVFFRFGIKKYLKVLKCSVNQFMSNQDWFPIGVFLVFP